MPESWQSVDEDKVLIYLVRHAESNLCIRDNAARPLTERGRKDARKVTALLQEQRISRVYSSPYVRAVDTVRDLAQVLRLEIVKNNDLREREVGGWVEDFHEYARQQWADFSYKNPSGESLAEVQKRNIDALKVIIKDNLGSTVVIGTHGTALSTIINYYRPDYGYEDFLEIIDKMPYVLCLIMDSDGLVAMEEIDLGT